MNSTSGTDKIKLSLTGLKPLNVKLSFKDYKTMPFKIDGQFPAHISFITQGKLKIIYLYYDFI